MRPLGLIGLIGLMGLTGCSQDDDLAPEHIVEQHAISFSGSQAEDEHVTRSTSLSTLRSSFKVWSYKNYSGPTLQEVIPGYQVNWFDNSANTTTSNTNGWEYVGQGSADQTIKYWDYDAIAYRFFALAPYMNVTPTYNGSPASSATLTIAADATTSAKIADTPYYSRLWYSDDNPVNYPDRRYGRPVTLTFLQPFALVRYMFTFTDNTVDRSDISTRSFAPATVGATIPRKGTVNITYPLLSGTEETYTLTSVDHTADLTSLDIDYYTTPDDAYKEYWYTVIPPNSQGDYKMSITIFGTNKEAIVPAQYMQWKPGFTYTYVFKITDAGGINLDVIQVGINEWTVYDIVEHPVYNW